MKSTISLVALVLAGALPIGAMAADPPKSPAATDPAPMPAQPAPDVGKTEVPPMFKELDQNKDGQVSKDEAKRSAEVQTLFDSMDSDRNGKISLVEWNTNEKQKPRAKP